MYVWMYVCMYVIMYVNSRIFMFVIYLSMQVESGLSQAETQADAAGIFARFFAPQVSEGEACMIISIGREREGEDERERGG